MNRFHPATDDQARHRRLTLYVPHPAEPSPTLPDYPELEPVLAAAVTAAVVSCYPEKIDAAVLVYLHRVTTAATLAIYAPLAAHAAWAARGAENSRAAQTRAVAQAAAEVTTRVTEAAADLQARATASADLALARAAAVVAQAATEAADEVAAAAEREAAAVHLRMVESAATTRGLWLEACFRFATTFAGSAAEAVLADGMPGEVTDGPPAPPRSCSGGSG